jgi:hypothetical protein
MGRNIAVEGMKTSCGAVLIASQQTDTVEAGGGARLAGGGALHVRQRPPPPLPPLPHWQPVPSTSNSS